ncbi:type II secretion system major pseudopilin GspG [Ningiella sp. W23]|uniref:type II secretion system major pseudopilin GspG n=1 Tax=Ningiella sp. W23 TaxID=3023715 RepID=UPI003756DC44
MNTKTLPLKSKSKSLRGRASSRGFSLIEVMIVIFIIGMIAALVVPNVIGNQQTAELKKAVIDIQSLENALKMYRLNASRYPTSEQGLDALVFSPTIEPIPRNYPEGGFIDRLPTDPWGGEYILLSPGEVKPIEVYSMGPDGIDGTEDDIGSWNLNDYL